ncbi:glycosyltransferase family 4 protein [Pseudoalteromonas sp. AS84]|uniref:glycosyltransferase family 4 protein n=1 Tax=Pseudoalteromonas sp. AS84 TaxID=3135778 RepID=UPI00317F1573
MIVMSVCHCDETNDFGGLEKQAFTLANELAKTYNVVMLSSTRKISNVGWSKINGINTLRLWTYTTPQVSGKKLPASLIWAAQLLFWLIKNRKKVDVFHCHQIRIHAFVAAFMNKYFNTKTILKSGVGGPGADINVISTHKYFGKRGQRFVVENNSYFISITETISKDLLKAGVKKDFISVIPNGFETPKVIKNKADKSKHLKNFVFLGRIESDKNIVELVEAALELLKEYEFVLNIYGKGQLKSQIEGLVLKQQASKNIKIFDYISDIPSVLVNNCWFVLPSDAEGLSNAMIEAMTYGAVPIVTKVSGAVDHIVEDENGYFIDGFDKQAIKKSLLKALNTEPEKWDLMSDNCKHLAIDRFSLQKVAGQYSNLYEKLRSK